jgi:ABC-type taurine transport system ATPase subunit
MDLFCNRFFHYPTDRAAKDPVRTQIACLDEREHHSRTFTGEVMIYIAASSSSNITLVQLVAGVCIYHLGKLISAIKRPSGITTSQDIIIQALCLGISKALALLPNISFI